MAKIHSTDKIYYSNGNNVKSWCNVVLSLMLHETLGMKLFSLVHDKTWYNGVAMPFGCLIQISSELFCTVVLLRQMGRFEFFLPLNVPCTDTIIP